MLTVSSTVEKGNHREERRRTESITREKPWEEALSGRGRLSTPANLRKSNSSRNMHLGSRSLLLEELSEGKLTWRQQLLLILEEPSYSLTARIISYFMLLTICGTICFFVLEAEPDLADWEGWYVLEVISTAIFTIEYLLRFLVCNAFGSPTHLEFLRTPMNVLDVLAISPFYVELLSQSVAVGPLTILRSVRLIRIFRIFRLSRYSMGMNIMLQSLVASVQPLIILVFFLCIGGTLFSSLVYYAEKMYCPDIERLSAAEFETHRKECINTDFDSQGRRCCDEFGAATGFTSIMDSTWWCVVTMTTVGYGDKVPATKLGQFVGGLTILSGIVLISLPVAIVGSRFQTAYEDAELERQRLLLEEKDRSAMEQALNSGTSELPEGGVSSSAQTIMKRTVSPDVMSQKSTGRRRDYSNSMSLRHQSTKSRKRSGTSSMDPDDIDSEDLQDMVNAETAEQLRGHLQRLRRTSNLTGATREQIRLLLALLDHIGSTEEKLKKLKERDAQMEARVNQSFSSLCRNYENSKRLEKVRTMASTT
eukprot:s189_g5.t1